MKKDNIAKQKSFEVAIKIVNLYKFLISTKQEYVLSRQLLRAGTSIGANIREAISGYSKADFRAKLSIAQKEACETEYWLQLLLKTGFISKDIFDDIFDNVNHVNNILAKTLINTR